MIWHTATTAATDDGSVAAGSSATTLDDTSCLACHGVDQKQIEVPDEDDTTRPLLMLERDKLIKGVHGKITCIACHTESIDNKAPHAKTDAPKPDSVTCCLDEMIAFGFDF